MKIFILILVLLFGSILAAQSEEMLVTLNATSKERNRIKTEYLDKGWKIKHQSMVKSEYIDNDGSGAYILLTLERPDKNYEEKSK